MTRPAVPLTQEGAPRPGEARGWRRETRQLLLVGALVVLTTAASFHGLLDPDAYRGVSALVRQTWRAQDAVNLAVVVVLVAACRRARAGSSSGHVVMTGLTMWLAYTYAHLAFAVPFTPAFLLHVAALSAAGFLALDGLVRADPAALERTWTAGPRRATGWFLVAASLGTGGLWLADIAAGLTGGRPAGLHLADLPNPTWVLDLGWVVPMAATAGVLLLRARTGGALLGATSVVMLAPLSVAMLAVVPFALTAGLGQDPQVVAQLTVFGVVFSVLGLVQGVLLVAAARAAIPEPSRLRTGWWVPTQSG